MVGLILGSLIFVKNKLPKPKIERVNRFGRTKSEDSEDERKRMLQRKEGVNDRPWSSWPTLAIRTRFDFALRFPIGVH